MIRILKYLTVLIASLIMVFLVFLVYSTLSDFNPRERILVYESDQPDTLAAGTYHALSWNLGYAGLGEDMDFFYDGGEQVRTSLEHTRNNLDFICHFVQSADSIDFFFLQEVDTHSHRTYRINEYDSITSYLSGYRGWFALNYKVGFVPMPPTRPMGKVNSGIAFFSRYEPSLVERFDFPGKYSWPTRVFMLDRCFMVAHFPLDNGHELLLITSHNSAFDDGSLKKEEMNYLKDYILQQAEAGNRILIGADWNQNPPSVTASHFAPAPEFDKFRLKSIDQEYLPSEWTWAFDPSVPTNRDLRKPYRDGETYTTILDFFLLSPGIREISMRAIELKFQHSDHNPVTLTFELE